MNRRNEKQPERLKDNPPWESVSPGDWQDWRWQMRNRITSVAQLQSLIELTAEETAGLEECLRRFRMAVTPYYASLMDRANRKCPIRKQAVPDVSELEENEGDMQDPLHEDVDSPTPGVTHRYPDRVLFMVTDQCAMYCRHCTRRRTAGTHDRPLPPTQIERALGYIAGNRQVRDVVVSGGDPLTLGNDRLEYILKRLRNINHVEIIRIGTRTPVVLPQRITEDLCRMLKKYHPLYLNTHFNHPREITPEAAEACGRLADAGIALGNQSVLLRGVNDCPHIMHALVKKLLRVRVRPYYLYQCDMSRGIGHFRTGVGRGIEILESLRGHTSGLGIPTYVIDAPGGGGKIPVNPQYVVSRSDHKLILRNFEGRLFAYTEPEQSRSECHKCTDCSKCPENAREGVAGMFAGKTPVRKARRVKTDSPRQVSSR
ncbi:MAG: lysine 2,3-aminomutase [Candidatus Desulforudis sp.]|nr:lysine 2,3-aminomutase [Desulforudis sp.]